MGDEVVRGRAQRLVGQGLERVEDEQGRAGAVAELRTTGLAPVPPPAGDPRVVGPDDLTRLGVLDDLDAPGGGVERLLAGGAQQPGRAAVAVEVLPAERDLVEHADGVVDVGQPVHPGEPGLGPTQQRLQAVAGALRLRAERPVRLPPRRHVRQLLDRSRRQRLARRGLRCQQQLLADRVARTRDDAVDRQQQRPVVRTQRQDRRRRPAPSKPALELRGLTHDRPPPGAPRRPRARRPRGRTLRARRRRWRSRAPRRPGTRPRHRTRGRDCPATSTVTVPCCTCSSSRSRRRAPRWRSARRPRGSSPTARARPGASCRRPAPRGRPPRRSTARPRPRCA